MLAAIRTCFAKYATFSGRAMRPEFWYFTLFLILMEFVLTLVNSALFGPVTTVYPALDGSGGSYTNQDYNSGWLGTLFTLATLIPALSVSWRRLHDIGRTGWWSVIPLALTAITAIVAVAMVVPSFAGGGDVELELTALAGGGLPLLLLGLGTFVSIIVLIIWYASPGTRGPNPYGPDPREVSQ
ncbi:MAG: DUF805 domain-containing protein [Pseudomonadota bacterium]